jgi:putative membrane protein
MGIPRRVTANSESAPPDNLDLTSAESSWIRSDLSNLRTLLSWVRTSVSMIGFGFTIDNFYSGFFKELGNPRVDTAARNLGLALVSSGTLALVLALWNSWALNQYLLTTPGALPVSRRTKVRWGYGDVVAVVMAIGLATVLFMLLVI